MKTSIEASVEAWLRERVAALQPGEELYLAPQVRVTVRRREHLVSTSPLAHRLGLLPGSEANRWHKP